MKIDAWNDERIPLRTVAKSYGITYQAVMRWKRIGLACMRVGGTWYTTAEALNDFAERSQAATDGQQKKSTAEGSDQFQRAMSQARGKHKLDV